MRKRERAAVVELLRCAADLANAGSTTPVSDAEYFFGGVGYGLSAECYLLLSTGGPFDPWSNIWSVEQCLEAALRVEQGEWP